MNNSNTETPTKKLNKNKCLKGNKIEKNEKVMTRLVIEKHA